MFLYLHPDRYLFLNYTKHATWANKCLTSSPSFTSCKQNCWLHSYQVLFDYLIKVIHKGISKIKFCIQCKQWIFATPVLIQPYLFFPHMFSDFFFVSLYIFKENENKSLIKIYIVHTRLNLADIFDMIIFYASFQN